MKFSSITLPCLILSASLPQAAAGQDHEHHNPAQQVGGHEQEGDDHSEHEEAEITSDTPLSRDEPPASAYAGPAFAAEEFFGKEKATALRKALAKDISGRPLFWFQGERIEYRAQESGDGYAWDIQGFYGGDTDKFWYKSEGEGEFGKRAEQAELQALWSRAIGPWWDLQTGIRQDLVGPARTHLAVGVQGLAPYWFEIDVAAFVSNKGDVTARLEGELDQRITQRLILQPRAEINLAAQNIPELSIGRGIDTIELGLRLRYEIGPDRKLAPYIGIGQEWKTGQSARFSRAAGEDPVFTNFIVGVRFWF